MVAHVKIKHPNYWSESQNVPVNVNNIVMQAMTARKANQIFVKTPKTPLNTEKTVVYIGKTRQPVEASFLADNTVAKRCNQINTA